MDTLKTLYPILFTQDSTYHQFVIKTIITLKSLTKHYPTLEISDTEYSLEYRDTDNEFIVTLTQDHRIIYSGVLKSGNVWGELKPLDSLDIIGEYLLWVS